MYLDIIHETNKSITKHQHGSYIKLIAIPCQEWAKYSSDFPEQPSELG